MFILTILTVRGMPTTLTEVTFTVGVPHLGELISHFLSLQLQDNSSSAPECDSDGNNSQNDLTNANKLPRLPADLYIRCVPSAKATFYSPSDALDATGLLTEHIRAVDVWMNSHSRYDTVFLVRDDDNIQDSDDEDSEMDKKPGFLGLFVGRVRSFFSFQFEGTLYPCALISEFTTFGNEPCPVTGMWRVTPDVDPVRRGPLYSVRHLDMILRAAHLIGYTEAESCTQLPWDFSYEHTLDSFQTFYVNKYIDHHAYEIAF